MEKETALENLRRLCDKLSSVERTALETLIPELAESEDEKIRKDIITFIEQAIYAGYVIISKERKEKWIAWLEKQGKYETIWKPTKEQINALTHFVRSVGESGYASPCNNNTKLLYSLLTDLQVLEKQGEQPQGKSALEVWKDMRLEVYQQASGNRHEPNYSDDSTKMFSLTDVDEIFEKIAEKQGEQKETPCDECKREQPYGSCQDINWNPTEEDVALFNKVVTTNTSLTPQDRAKLDIIRMKFKHHPNIEQNEQKPFDYENATIVPKDFAPKGESKFKAGDWVVDNQGRVSRVASVTDDGYGVTLYGGTYVSGCWKDDYHHWTIDDAKDGDVLQSGDCTFVFKEIKDGWIYCYCMYHRDGSFVPETYALMSLEYGHEVSPAAFIEYQKLEEAVKEAGYAWDVYTKTLTEVNKEQ